MTFRFAPTRSKESYTRRAATLYGFESGDEEFIAYCNSVLSQLIVPCPPQGYFPIEDVYVFESKHVMVEADLFLPDSIVDFNAAPEFRNHVRYRAAGTEHIRLPASDRLDVLFAKAGASNYGHFLSDCLAKLINLLPLAQNRIRLHLPHESARYEQLVVDVCAALGLNTELYRSAAGEVTHLERAIYLSNVAKHNTRKSRTFQELRDLIMTIHSPSSRGAPRRIYIDRTPDEIRHISNGAEIATLFEARGYEIVRPATLTIREQIALFNDASDIAGPLGAGLTNAMWAGSGARVMMIDPGLTDFYFWDISGQFQQRFHWHFAAPPRRYDVQMELDPFSVDAALLEQSVDAMLSD